MLKKKSIPKQELKELKKVLKVYERKLKAFEKLAKKGTVRELPKLSFSR